MRCSRWHTPHMTLRDRADAALRACGAIVPSGADWTSRSPIDGSVLGTGAGQDAAAVAAAIERAHSAFLQWRQVPAPQRGFVVKRWGRLIEEHKADLATLVTLEVGKIESEALGEVQEMADICDFALGLSRQLEGRTMPSERPGGRLGLEHRDRPHLRRHRHLEAVRADPAHLHRLRRPARPRPGRGRRTDWDASARALRAR